MGKRVDLIGKKFNRLTVVERVGVNVGGSVLWLCKCDCGRTFIDTSSHITSGHTKSCGCFRRERSKQLFTKHGKKDTRLYNIWCSMKQRCYDENCNTYKNYGGRGIKICDGWKNDFMKFYNWSIDNGYNNTLSIDRIDVNGNYEPSNCRWSTREEQNDNRRTTRYITYNGVTKTIKQWSDYLSISHNTLYSRLYRGWDTRKIIDTPCKKIGSDNDGKNNTI